MRQDPIERWIARLAEASQPFLRPKGPHTWLLKQSIYTHYQRLIPLLSMPCFQAVTGSILDVGAGTGALSLDLAWRIGDKGLVTALDSDREALKIVRALAHRLDVNVETMLGDATALPVQDATQAMSISRFLLQHLPDPLAALLQMRRVTRPGGRVVIIDVDDGVSLYEPALPKHLAALRTAIRSLQRRRGGNRRIGRQLYRLMCQAGLTEIQVIVIPRVQLGSQLGRSAEREAYRVEQLEGERDAILSAGLMTSEDFDAALSEMEWELAQDSFVLEADFLAMGTVPAP